VVYWRVPWEWLFEEIEDDEAGHVKGRSPVAGLLPAAFEPAHGKTGKPITAPPHHPLGAKRLGESAAASAPAAIVHGGVYPLAHRGLRQIDIRITPANLTSLERGRGGPAAAPCSR